MDHHDISEPREAPPLTPDEFLERLRRVCEAYHITPLNPHLRSCQALLAETGVIDVAILGQFKAGKSSFVNNLIGKMVLPVGVIPVTTVITRLSYGPGEKAVVTHLDGSRQSVPLSAIEDFISEANNPGNRKCVEVVDIEVPSLQPFTGLRIVDTPGLGSVLKYNTATSEEWLPRVGAAMVAISADRPLSDNDLRLIGDLIGLTPRIVLLLTKADLLTPDQQKEVVQFFRTTLKRELGREFPIYLFSTVTDTKILRHMVDGFLLSLAQDRESQLSAILHHKFRSLTKQCFAYLEIALKAAVQADADQEELKRMILDEKVSHDLIRSELSLLSRESMLRTRTVIADRLETVRLQLTRDMTARLTAEMPSWNGNLWVLTRRYEAWLEENLIRELEAISRAEHTYFFTTLHSARSALFRSVTLFRTALEKNIEKVFGIAMAELDWKIEVAEPGEPDIGFTKVFDIHLDLLWFLIPMSVFRRAFERYFLKQIPRLVEVQLSRLAYQWEVKINRTIEEMRGQAIRYVSEELETIDLLLSRTGGQVEEIRRAMDELVGLEQANLV